MDGYTIEILQQILQELRIIRTILNEENNEKTKTIKMKERE